MAHVSTPLCWSSLTFNWFSLRLPPSASFVHLPSFFSFSFFSSSYMLFRLQLHPLGPFVLCGSCSLILCVLTPYMQTLIFELMSIKHWQQIKGPTIQNFKLYFSGLCLVYGLRSTSQNFELYFIGLCLVHGSGQPISLVQPMDPIILILLFL